MRKDLNKQLCERERVMSKDHYSNYRHDKVFKDDTYKVEHPDNVDDYYDERNIVHGGHRESMTIRYAVGGWGKTLNENLNPLWGIVRKNVGRKWDDVYSEICSVFDKRSVINNHILEHLFQWVETKTYIGDDGEIWYNAKWGGDAPITATTRYVQFYVHPETGILCKLDNKSYKQECRERAAEREKEELKVRRVINPTTELRCIDGVWYEVKFEDYEGENKVHWYSYKHAKPLMVNSKVYPEKYDVLLKTNVSTHRVAVAKRQLSSKEKKKHGLV